MIHSDVHVHQISSGQAHSISFPMMLAVVGGAALAVHLVRAALVRDAAAAGWLRRRGLPQDARSIDLTVQYLLRLRWARVASTAVMLAVCGLALLLSNTWISFVSLPFLLSVLVAESLAPDPRRGRVRSASLERRARSYFAPILPLLLARTCILAAALLSVVALAWGTTTMVAPTAVHAAVMVVGGVALEACLHSVSTRALPDRNPDLALDTAMRVASARIASAAALLFGVFGLLLAVGAIRFSSPAGPWSMVINQVMSLAMLAAVGAAIGLVQPLTSWRPRGAR
jgi:hypothetical protein